MNTGNCYDPVVESNLNAGLPKGISYITDKNLKGKKKVKKDDEESESSLEIDPAEKEIYFNWRKLAKERRKMEQEDKDVQHKIKLEERQKVFNLHKEDEEAK